MTTPKHRADVELPAELTPADIEAAIADGLASNGPSVGGAHKGDAPPLMIELAQVS